MNIELPTADIPSSRAITTMPAIERLQPGITERDGEWVVLIAREHRDLSYIEQEHRWREMINWGRENNSSFVPRMLAQVGEPFWQAVFPTYGTASLFYLRWS